MKKKISIISIAIFILSILVGCGSATSESLRICIDIKDLMVVSDKAAAGVQADMESNAAEMLLSSIKDRGGPENIEFEFIPADGEARNSALSRIRTEIISGKGPDVFIVNCVNNGDEDALFKSPGAAMELNLFLPLDAYISKAKYMDWDKLNPVVMSAGKNEEGQQLLPLSYTFPVSIFKKQDVTFSMSPNANLYDMLNGGLDSVSAAMPIDGAYRHLWSDYAFGAMADYKNEQLLISEDDLLKWEETQQVWYKNVAEGKLEGYPPHDSTSMNVGFNRNVRVSVEDFYKNLSPEEELTFLPMYSTQGGVVATIMSFAGINRNTRWPDDAFQVLDILLDREVQQYSEIYKLLLDMRAIPVHQELMQENTPVAGWYMDNNLYEEFVVDREQITIAKFRSEFENELLSLDSECFRLGTGYEKAVNKAYTTMQMILAES